MRLLEALRPLPGGTGAEFAEWSATLPTLARECVEKASGTLGPLFCASPYLLALAKTHTDWLVETLQSDADTSLAKVLAEAAGSVSLPTDEIAAALRVGKARVALLAGIAETGLAWTTAQATCALSDYADVSLHTAIGALMRDAAENGKITFANQDRPDFHPAAECGLAIFALGKHGGQELNYSSDIDIVAFYDKNLGILVDPDEANKFYTRILQKLVAIMEERDANGNVFRTDLRLRPDPGSTPLGLGVNAAMQYYESRGQNWERAAWIKARVCAGDHRVGEDFLAELSPFIWRKHLDFATIQDIQSIKRQINLARRIGDENVENHNVKLGRGGIREIEFFAQTQQLIAGGRDMALRVRPTAEALRQLAVGKWISRQTADELTETYWYLRAVENRLQMLRDEQTHTLPGTEEEVGVIAHLMGSESVDDFKRDYRAATGKVIKHYLALFAQEKTLGSDAGDLVFTGSDDDPATLETLQQMGFRDAAKTSATVRKWHYGGYAATRTAAARAHLTSLLPSLLTVIGGMGNADEALMRFDNFVSRLPAGVQLFALLNSQEHLTRLLVLFMASAPRLAEEVIHRAHVMDGLIDPTFADDLNKPTGVADKVDAFLSDANSYEDLIDRARIIGQEQKFLISAGLVSSTISAEQAGKQFGILAEKLLGLLFNAVQREFALKHGKVPGARVALLAFGKIASQEMTATSDIDFIMLYEVPEGVDASNGAKPLDPSLYFARLTQRLLTGLSAPTAAGVLYEADMRLRPSGHKGPLATSFAAFRTYQEKEAWTWEHLALTRARVVCGDSAFASVIQTEINAVLGRKRDATKTIDDVVSMRNKMAAERPPRHEFDLKLAPGGLVDIEFIAQSAQLLAFEEIGLPGAPIVDVLARMQTIGLLDGADRLVEIAKTYAIIMQAMSTCLIDPFRPDAWTDAFQGILAHLCNAPSFEFLETDVTQMKRDVLSIADDWYAKARSL